MAAAVPLSDAGNHIPATNEGVPHSNRLQIEAIVCPVSNTQKLPTVRPAKFTVNRYKFDGQTKIHIHDPYKF